MSSTTQILLAIWAYIGRVFSSLSQVLNALLLGGDSNESICGRCYRESWIIPMRVLNVIFSPVSRGQHCRGAYNNDRAWAQKASLWPERVDASEQALQAVQNERQPEGQKTPRIPGGYQPTMTDQQPVQHPPRKP